MIRIGAADDGKPLIVATSRGLAVYLDNWAIGELAEGDASRRQRFLNAFRSDVADLMFSVTNAVELPGPQGRSRDMIREFLSEIGPNWFPVELNLFEVIEREKNGMDPSRSCVSDGLARAYFTNRLANYPPEKIIDLSDSFYDLSALLDWLESARARFRGQTANFDELYKTELEKLRSQYKGKEWPVLAFNPKTPATFTTFELMKVLITEPNQWKAGDAMDLCHAVMGSAYGSIATLDKHWKRRVESLPQPNRLAHIYYAKELDKMVEDIEEWVKQKIRESTQA
jgi:hypothetical protein